MVEESKPDGKPNLTVEWFPPRGKGQRGTVVVWNGDEAPCTDRLDIAKPGVRSNLMNALAKRWPTLRKDSDQWRDLKAELELLAAGEVVQLGETDEPPGAQGPPDPAELLAATPEHIRAGARSMSESPDLLEQIGADFSAAGIAGERSLAGTIYLARVSRLLDRPLALLIQGVSSSGKNHVLRRVAQLFPPEAI